MIKTELLTAKILNENSELDAYQLSLAVAKRADQLLDGATSKLQVDPKRVKAADIALMEIAEGLITINGFIDNKSE